MPKAFPLEFRRNVVAVARQSDAPIAQVARDFGISESCLQRWLKLNDVEEGRRPGVTQAESTELREAKKRIRLLEQENEVLRRAAVYLGRESTWTAVLARGPAHALNPRTAPAFPCWG